MDVRLARKQDARSLARLHVAAWQVAYRGIVPDEVLARLSVDDSETTWRRLLAHRGRRNLVCEIDGEVAGFVAMGSARDPDVDPGRTAEVYGLYVAPERWGQGGGRALWQAALEELLGTGYEDVVLWVYEANARARGFYERAGFRLEPDRMRRVERYGVAPPEVRYHRKLEIGGGQG